MMSFWCRGEIIGNAVADKREKQYEDMQIGSDYMFRVDEVRRKKVRGSLSPSPFSLLLHGYFLSGNLWSCSPVEY